LTVLIVTQTILWAVARMYKTLPLQVEVVSGVYEGGGQVAYVCHVAYS